MALQTRKWPEELGRAIGTAALEEESVKTATSKLHAGKLADFGPVPMPYATVSYYARKVREERQREAQEEEERLRPKPVDERIDAAGRQLLELLERGIAQQVKTSGKDARKIGEYAASLKKVRELMKPDEPSRPAPGKPSDPLTDALTRPSRREPISKGRQEALAPKPTNTENTSEAMRSVDEPREPATIEDEKVSGVPASVAENGSHWSRPFT